MKPHIVELWHAPFTGASERLRAQDRAAAGVLAAELLAMHADAMAYVRCGSKRWRVILNRDYSIRYEAMYDDGVPVLSAAAFAGRRASRFAKLVSRENRRRLRKRTEMEQRQAEAATEREAMFGNSWRPVVCLETATPFACATDALRWIGVKSKGGINEAIQRNGRCGRLHWQWADVLLKELENVGPTAENAGHGTARPNARALREAAERAMLLRKQAQIQKVSRRAAWPARDAAADAGRVTPQSQG